MTTDSFELDDLLPALPEVVYDAWTDATGHTRMTGAGATSDPRAGGAFTAWDGYITGTHVELERPRRILQRWRTAEFPEGAADSRLEIRLDEEGGGARIRILHSEIPAGQGGRYEAGWVEHYLEPMKRHFGGG
ncbi:MAG: SRPBCC domain-containing protein [Sandaracinaceae bacterium]